jgi:hypothetical protein
VPAGLDRACGYRSMSLRLSSDGTPASLDEKNRSVEVVAATETPVQVFDWERWEVVHEVLLMSGLEMPPSRQVVLLDSHYRGGAESVIGSARELQVAGADLQARAHFTSQPEGEGPYSKLREGHLTDFSVGYRIDKAEWVPEGETATIAGRKFSGPVKVVTAWKIRELSVCPIGADELAKARAENPAPQTHKENDMDKAMRAFLERQGLSKDATDEEAKRFLDELNTRGAVITPPATPAATPTAEELEKIRSEAVGKERGRIGEIDAMCRKYGCEELAGPMIVAGDSVDAARVKVLEQVATRRQEPNNLGFRVEVGAEAREKFQAAASDGLMLRAGIAAPQGRQMAPGADELAGFTLRELARHALVVAGERVPSNPMEMIGRALTSADLPVILGNTANLSLQSGFDAADETYAQWCGEGSVSDFKTHTAARASESDDLAEVPDGGQYKYGDREEQSEQYSIATYGRIFPITRQSIINDELGALTTVPFEHGEAANRKIGDVAYAVLTANANMGDGAALFVAAHGNLAAGGNVGAVAIATMAEAIRAMKTQKDIKGKRRLNIRPMFYLAPVTAEGAAEVFFRSERFTDSDTVATDSSLAGSRVNPYSGNYITRVYDSRLDDDSTTAWYLSAKKGQFVKLFFLNGVKRPYLEVQRGWTVDGVENKVRIDVGAKAMNWKGGYKNPGA